MSESLPDGWVIKDNALEKTFVRANFPAAIALVNAVVPLAETANHHPDIDIRHRKVRFVLTTHDAGSIVTEKDFQLAEQIEQLSVTLAS